MKRFLALPLRTAQRGLTLIELMVSLLIGMLLTLAIFAVLASAEGLKRSTNAVNDINQAGTYAMYAIDKWVRSAGSGFAQSGAFTFGCDVHASTARAGTGQVLPATSAAPAPFAAVNTTGTAGQFRLAPLLIAPGQTTPNMSGQASDVLIVMAGAAGGGEAPIGFSDFPVSSGGASTLNLMNTVSFRANDLVLVADVQGTLPCMVQQVGTPFAGGTATAMDLGGDYHAPSIASANLTAITDLGVAMNLGNSAGNNPPAFLMIGVGDNNTLYSYDLLQTTATPLLPVADGVFELHARYGVDTDDDGRIDDWADASTSADYSLGVLTAGTPGAAQALQRIKAVRVGLILRTSLPEKATDYVAPSPITLFSDLNGGALTYTRDLTTAIELSYRYRTVEATIPLRNSLMLNTAP